MEVKRRPFQGVANIVRFNWHFYFFSLLAFTTILLLRHFLPEEFRPVAVWGAIFFSLTIIVSLAVSYFVYDHSNLYDLQWLPNSDFNKLLNINAGFDETSEIIKRKFPNVDLTICDFYDEAKHTEVSVRRARAAFPPPISTVKVSTHKLPFHDATFDNSLAILSAHEIRNKAERVQFFKELDRVTKPTGNIYVTEHLQDLHNFMGYTIGFLHFHSKSTWLETFQLANLTIKSEIKTTPFITTFILSRNGDAS